MSRETRRYAGEPALAPRLGRRSLRIERRLLSWVLQATGDPPLHFVLWDGTAVVASGDPPKYPIRILDRGALWGLITYPEYSFPEMYAQGRIVPDGDLVPLMEIIQRARRDVTRESLTLRLLTRLFRPRPGSLSAARENIHHHYDIGNDFYRLWLDEQLVYTCAYYPTEDTDLAEAQIAKMDHVCRKLRLQPGERVIEAGCGWGALALHMARHYGVKVRAYNISKAQLELARERAAREGLHARVEFVEGDYREIDGACDAFVSVGMLEHVGPARYPELGRVMDRCLTQDGRGLIHSIGCDRPGPMNAWIERRIFPGAYPPSLDEMMALFGPHGFSVLDVENLRLHYARTLAHWLERFEAAEAEVQALFDPAFVRAWRFYLAASQVSFTIGHLQLFQVLFARRRCNSIPWTRRYMYPPTKGAPRP